MTGAGQASFYGCDLGEIQERLAPLAAPAFAARQIHRWMYARRAGSFAEMSDLSLTLRARLDASFELGLPEIAERHPVEDGTTRYVWRLADGERTESVWIPGGAGQATLCLSSQVGCALACAFCVSGLLGVRRNLTSGEILAQARGMLAEHPPRDRVNIVFMGMGEALANFDNLVRAFRILADRDGFGIALRRQTVSTAGHVPSIERFAALPARPRLAVSLNATTDEQRTRIMPINRSWPIARLLLACRRVPLAPGERITFEYVLLAGVNDSAEDARRLARLVASLPAKINLIPFNPAAGLPFSTPEALTVDRFAAILRERGQRVTLRRRRGAEAGAACGQLALRRSSPVP